MLSVDSIHQTSFWSTLCPSCSIESTDVSLEKLKPSQEQLTFIGQHLFDEGYFHQKGQLPLHFIEKLAADMCRIHAKTKHPLFIWVFDQPWLLLQALSPLLAHILGEDFLFLPRFWSWHISAGQKGWKPHRDRGICTLEKDKTPQIITLWIPLSHASPENGCIYVLPATADPGYLQASELHLTQETLHAVRALPASPSDILGWTHHLYHWGGTHQGKTQHVNTPARLSLAIEIQKSTAPEYASPLLSLNALPPFELRLQLIAEMMTRYRHLHPIPKALVPWLRQMGTLQKRSFSEVLVGLLKK